MSTAGIDRAGQGRRRVHVDSDVAALQRVVVHRPGTELARVTTESAGELLFDHRVPIRAAQAEHAELRSALLAAGAEVIEAETALERLVRDPGVRGRLVDRLCEPDEAAREWLLALPSPRVARVLVTGLAADEVPAAGRASVRRMHGSERWLVRPLPNLMFTRDLFAIVGAGAIRGRMACAARRPEGLLAEAMLAHRDMRPLQSWAAGDLQVEGGDVLALGDGVVLVGVGERTSLPAARTLAERLLRGGGAREVIAGLIPPGGPFHVDLVLGTIDPETVLVDSPVADAIQTLRWRFGQPGRSGGRLVEAVEAALGRPLRVIRTLPERHERSWDRGANVLAVRPGTVIAYADNRATNRRLEQAGVEVWRVGGRALGAGRGGPRCLTAPLAREARERRPPDEVRAS